MIYGSDLSVISTQTTSANGFNPHHLVSSDIHQISLLLELNKKDLSGGRFVRSEHHHNRRDRRELRISVVEVGREEIKPFDWDVFSQKCSVSFRCSYAAIRAWLIDEGKVFVPLKYFEVYDQNTENKIGQCAVATSGSLNIFCDTLQLLPEYAALWQQVMAQLLAVIGPGSYRYGSLWNIEPSREEMLQDIRGVSIGAVAVLPMQAVNFERWRSWEHYFGEISSNARRNARRASQTLPTPSIRIRTGLATLLDALIFTRLHREVASRKKMHSPIFRVLPRYIARTISLRKYIFSAVVTGEHSYATAAFTGIEFGKNTYYMYGGSKADNGGTAWLLMLQMLRRAYDRSEGAGKFFMGAVTPSEPGWSNLARSREQCRVTEFPANIITFSYSAE